MLKHLQQIIAEFNCVPKRLLQIVSQYIMFLMLDHKKHEVRTASRVFGTHESNYSRMLSREDARPMSRGCLNRAIKRKLSKFGDLKDIAEAYLIIDSTITSRSGKKIKNRHKFRHGGPYVEGHQFTNFVLLVRNEVIPLASVPFYSKKYCREIGIHYQTEIEMITEWIEMLPMSDLLPGDVIKKLHFILDSGYDAKPIQNAIHNLKAKFTVGITCERNINGLGVKEYFHRNRQIPWKTICLNDSSGYGKIKRRKFRVRAAGISYLKGFGEVKLVCSEKRSRIAKKTKRKYIVTNNLKQSAKKTVRIYLSRWAIETWHKNMKQNYGYGDCRSREFHAVEAHINFALCAYCLVGLGDPKLPRRGITLEQYCGSSGWQDAKKVINLFNGKEKIKSLANEELARIING